MDAKLKLKLNEATEWFREEEENWIGHQKWTAIPTKVALYRHWLIPLPPQKPMLLTTLTYLSSSSLSLTNSSSHPFSFPSFLYLRCDNQSTSTSRRITEPGDRRLQVPRPQAPRQECRRSSRKARRSSPWARSRSARTFRWASET